LLEKNGLQVRIYLVTFFLRDKSNDQHVYIVAICTSHWGLWVQEKFEDTINRRTYNTMAKRKRTNKLYKTYT